MTASLYPHGFYENRRAHTAHAASRLLSALPPQLPRRSVADIGCGTGTWLAAALQSGSQSALGIEGNWVADLVASAPAILFSAAIPGQGGVGHRNERWQSYWAALFAEHGYTAHDIIRPAIWADDAIPAWYRQNAVLYLDEPTRTRVNLEPTDPTLLDTVHPSFWERANRELHYANALPESEVLRRQAQQAQQ